MKALLRDVQYGVRIWRKNPGFACAAVVMIAIGIAATTSIFTLAGATLLSRQRVREPARLVNVHRTEPDGTTFHGFSYPNFSDMRQAAHRLEGLAAFTGRFVSLREDNGSVPIAAQVVSGNYFEVLGLSPFQGRVFGPSDERAPGASPVAVMSYRLWRQRFSGDPHLLGRVIRLNGHPFTVVGILPASFSGTFAGFKFDLWLPITMASQVAPGSALELRGKDWLELIGRLAPGASIDSARAELNGIAANLAKDFPEANHGMGIDVRPNSPVDDGLRPVLLALFGLLSAVSGLVLLIACANVAGLLAARNSTRGREMAIRQAIGAGKTDLLRQTLTETLLLFLAGGAAGFCLSIWLSSLLATFTPRFAVALELDLRPDLRAFGFSAAVSAVAALLSGLSPALSISRLNLFETLRGTGGSSASPRSRRIFVALQLALSTILLVAAGLLAKSVHVIGRTDQGFDSQNVQMATVNVALLSTDEKLGRNFYREISRRLETIPGVESAGIAERVPLGGFGRSWVAIQVPGRRPPTPEGFQVEANSISAGYLRTLRIPLISGRELRDSDDENAPGAALVNETFARNFWPGEDALGRTFQVGASEYRVVGVVRSGKYKSLRETPQPAVYFSFPQRFSPRMTILLRTRGPVSLVSAELRKRVAAISPDLPLLDTMALSDFIGVAFLPQRLARAVTTALGLVGLLLAAVGLHALFANEVAVRRREIGVRMALGANRSSILGLILRRGFALSAAGIGAGIAGSLAAGRLLAGLLFGVRAADPLILVGAAVILGCFALLATYLPAVRASRVDPVTALRAD